MTVQEKLSTPSYNREKTVGITTLTVAGVDVLVNLVSLEVFEDIFSHFSTVELTILDSFALTEDPGIFGGEEIVIDFESTEGFPSYSKTFKVYKITNMSNGSFGEKHKSYTLHGITAPAFTNIEKRMSRTYKEMTEDKIVSDVCQNLLGIEVEAEDALNDRFFVVPNMRPVSVIQEMCRSAIRKNGYPTANFIFYEDKNKFHFRSLDDLIEQGKKWDMYHSITAQVSNDQYAQLNARSFNNLQTYDFFKNVDSGMYGTRHFFMNLYEKEYDKKDYIYSSEFDGQAKIDGNNDKLIPGPPSFPEQQVIFGPRDKAPKRDTSSYFSDEHRPKRKSIMRQFENNLYAADVDGDTNLVVGDILEFHLPSYDSTGDFDGWQEELDEKYSGNYIVAQIRHSVNNTEHRMTLGLIKHQVKS